MDWFSKIFGDSDSDRSSFGDRSPNYTAPSTSGDVWSEEDENEDIDRAIALSLSEKSLKRQNITEDDDSRLEEDEQLARAIQESLNIGNLPPDKEGNSRSPPPHRRSPEYGNETLHVPEPFYYPQPVGYRICTGCNGTIDHGRFVSTGNEVWHPECFRCHSCGLVISNYDEFDTYGDRPYHKYCYNYKDKFHPKCYICKHFIPADYDGRIKYGAHRFWSQSYCPSHEHDGTPRCCSCERMEPRDTKYVVLKDGRELCLECLDTVIMDMAECQPLYRDIQRFYENLDMKLEQDVPLLLVERQALNEVREGEKNGPYHMPETQGLCLSVEHTISTVSRRPRTRGDQTAADNIVTEPYRLTRHCEVTAILVLYGLPRLQTGKILDHEMMHAWLRLKGFPALPRDVEEGICQVLGHMWLESELNDSRSRTSNLDQKLGEFFKHQVESDVSPVYGEGFRAGFQAVRKYGLNRTLDHISVAGNFPS